MTTNTPAVNVEARDYMTLILPNAIAGMAIAKLQYILADEQERDKASRFFSELRHGAELLERMGGDGVGTDIARHFKDCKIIGPDSIMRLRAAVDSVLRNKAREYGYSTG